MVWPMAVRFSVELALPEGIAEDDGGTAAFYEFIRQELAAEVGLDAEGLEKIAE